MLGGAEPLRAIRLGELVGGVGDDVARLAAGGEVLAGDVVALLGEQRVDLGEHAGDVDVQEAQPVTRLGQRRRLRRRAG